ncbi:MAG: hypothetical protein L6U16_10540 [Porphyromonadaceae bacterium]|nr:MAG: hypothetical protein L6U16_10540 [Porphyromonadaceae bacterium]
MTDKEIEIANKTFMKKGVEMSLFTVENMETGFITEEIRNHINRKELIEIAGALRSVALTVAKTLEENGVTPNQTQSGLIFQYFFDRAVEIFYKQYHGIETDSVTFNIQEVFDYYEPDLPYNVQQILTNRVGNIAVLTSKLWSFMESTNVFDTSFNVWFSNFLSVATTIGLRFAQEIDFDDQSELNEFLDID